MAKDNPLDKVHKSGGERSKLESGEYYAIANGIVRGKDGKKDFQITKGQSYKLTADQATALCKSIVTAKEAGKLFDKAAKGMTTKALKTDSED